MALTPEDVRNKRFTAVRFKEGYDLDEVDAFLDEVEESLAALTKENGDLRATARGDVPSTVRESLEQLDSENAGLKRQTAELEAQVISLQEALMAANARANDVVVVRSEEHTSELQSH